MHETTAVWIDHSQAVIVFADAGKFSTETIESSLEPHTRYQDSTGYLRSDGPHAGAGEKKYERRFRQHLNRYMDDVILYGTPERLADRLRTLPHPIPVPTTGPEGDSPRPTPFVSITAPRHPRQCAALRCISP